jgi:DNA-binding HxlR family transcriptional regulator
MRNEHRSRCPINLSLEVLGDRWSLLILRDMMFAGKRHFREFLHSEEGISSNILADRIRRLSEEEMITKAPDPTHKQKAIYSLTEKSIALVPVFVQLGVWGSRHLPASEESSASAWVLEEGGPRMWERFMSELRKSTSAHRTVVAQTPVRSRSPPHCEPPTRRSSPVGRTNDVSLG